MKEAIHLRFEQSKGHQRISVFIDGGNCGTLTMKPEEAIWFNHICTRGCDALSLTFNSSGIPIDPPTSDIDRFAVEHNKRKK